MTRTYVRVEKKRHRDEAKGTVTLLSWSDPVYPLSGHTHVTCSTINFNFSKTIKDRVLGGGQSYNEGEEGEYSLAGPVPFLICCVGEGEGVKRDKNLSKL